MIVRVFNEAQYEVPDDALGELNELDRRCQVAVEASDDPGFHSCYEELLTLLRNRGTPLADDDLRTSQLMLPPPDISLQEARSEFSGHGLIPD
jgi:PspAA-like protein